MGDLQILFLSGYSRQPQYPEQRKEKRNQVALGKIKKRILLLETWIKCQSRADISNLKAGRTSKQSHHEDTLLFLKAMSSGYCLSLVPSSQWSCLYSYLAFSVKVGFPSSPNTIFARSTIYTAVSRHYPQLCIFSCLRHASSCLAPGYYPPWPSWLLPQKILDNWHP